MAHGQWFDCAHVFWDDLHNTPLPRFLTNEADVWSQNAWDHVPPPTDQDEVISAALNRQKSAPVPDEEKPKYNDKPARHWLAIECALCDLL